MSAESFKIIKPFEVSDVALVSSTVSAVDPYSKLLSNTISTSSVAAATTITTSTPHLYTIGQNFIVTISGHTGSTPSINGEYLATSTGASTFTIPVTVTVGGTGGTMTSPAYSSGTTYVTGEIVQVDNPTFTFTANGYLFTATNHGFGNGTMLQVSSSGTLPTGLTANTKYYMVQITLNTFKLSTQRNGTPIGTTSAGTGTHTCTVSTHILYESLVDGNVGNTPHLNTSTTASQYWLAISPTNRWRCMDLQSSSQTSSIDSATYIWQCTGVIDSIYVGNCEADTATVTARTTGGGAIVYGPTVYNLRKYVTTPYDWFYAPIERAIEFVDIDLPPYVGLQVEVTLTKTGGTVKAGTILMGLSQLFGVTNAGASFGMHDFSIKTANEFGIQTFTERTYARTSSVQITLDNTNIDSVYTALIGRRATPMVFVITTLYPSAAILFGKFNSFTIAVPYATTSVCSIEVESLT